jgi:hypothetical protein
VNYFLIYFGPIPEYLKYTVKSIKNSDPIAKIFILSTHQFEDQGVVNIRLDDLKNSTTKEILSSNYYKNQYNPLWNTSMARVFAIQDMANYLGISKNIIHFDVDVLIFDDFSKYKKKFDESKGLHITQKNSQELVFGFSYINEIRVYEKICNVMYEKLFGSQKIAEKSNSELNNYTFNEMNMLREVEVENKGYIHPITSVPASESDVIFDPLDIGYLLGGQDKYENVPTINSDNYLGRYIFEDKMCSSIEFIDKKPFLNSHGIKNKVFNIHVHNKKLISYL